MQALAERLEAAFGGASLSRIDPLQFAALKTVDPSPSSLVGRTLSSVGRRGKFLSFDLDGPRILVHLSQGGRVDIEEPQKTTRPKGAVVRFAFDNGRSLLVKEYGTERKAGWWVVGEDDEGPLSALGPEPGSEEFRRFIETSDDGRRIHTMLRDQRTVAGIGRGYSDDILHRAQISPYAPLAKLDAARRRRLIDAIDEVLEDALQEERKRTGGLPAKLQGRFRVHGQHGRPCPRCGDELRRVSYESYEIVYCPRCQTDGQVLADRRLSRIVR